MQRDKQIFDLILEEQERQIHGLELIASENFICGHGSSWFCFDQQICGRISWKRYYGGCEVVDVVEQIAIDRAKELFG
jgi:glycine hydroxymethyltransferase